MAAAADCCGSQHRACRGPAEKLIICTMKFNLGGLKGTMNAGFSLSPNKCEVATVWMIINGDSTVI